MIDRTFLHLPGVGPSAESKILDAGLICWSDLLCAPDRLPFRPRQPKAFFDLLQASQTALERGDIPFLVAHLVKKEQWRILNAFRDQISYFDIETNGLDMDAMVTVIGCYHRGQLHHFVRGRNLDQFLELLQDITLLVSFNGSTFDIPKLCRNWCIPDLGVPHIDLRWQCYHRQLRGGLKDIERRLGIQRPLDLDGIDGEAAIWLWNDWLRCGDRQALRLLIRYCCADVLALSLLNDKLLQEWGVSLPARAHTSLWRPLADLAEFSQ